MKAFRILAAALALTALPRTAAHACSCITEPAGVYLGRAAVAFSGEARLVEPQRGGVVIATFKVARVYKGSVSEEALIFTGADAAGCGIAFTQKRSYTVFASRNRGALIADLCSGTAEGQTLGGTRVIKDYSAPAVAPPAASVPVAQLPVASKGPDPSRTLPIAAGSILACAVAVSILRRSSAS